jgi:hypothetical protein
MENAQLMARHRSPVAEPEEISISNVWTASFVGLVILILAIVAIRFNIAEIEIGITALGVALSTDRFRIPLFVWLFLLYLAWALISSSFLIYVEQAIGVFAMYSRPNLLYITLAICWCANELVFVRPALNSKQFAVSGPEPRK